MVTHRRGGRGGCGAHIPRDGSLPATNGSVPQSGRSASPGAVMQQTEIRLFGRVWVRRSDGTVVQPTEWRTTKTVDLLRLLALDPHMSVPVARIRSLLWPDSDEIHAGASLRTATSQLRKALGPDVVERKSASLGLRHVWVDSQRHAGVLAEIDRARRQGDDAAVVSLVREADALYTGDIEAEDTSGDWLRALCAQWRARHAGALVDGADAAARLHWMRDCVDLAERAAALDPHSEDAVRTLMRGLAGLGRTAPALAAFERLRTALAEQFGVDPAPQTRALHLQLLRAGRPEGRRVPLRHPATATMVDALTRLRRSDAGRGVVWVTGPRGSGRADAVMSACAELGLTLRGPSAAAAQLPLQRSPGATDRHAAEAVVLLASPWDCAEQVRLTTDELPHAIVVALLEPGEIDVAGSLTDIPAETVHVVDLNRDELRALARDVLQAEPTEALLVRLCADTGCLAGLAREQLARWLAGGDVVWTPDGMDLSPGDPDVSRNTCVPDLLRRLPGLAADVLAAVATADGDLTDEQIGDLFVGEHLEGPAPVAEAVDSLLDAGLLSASPIGVHLTDRGMRAQILGWVRPSVRRRLEQRVAMLLGRHLRLAPQQVGGRVVG
jgi:DNA-binding SARP family transcriptional activator